MGLRDLPFLETVEDGEKQRQMQAPNREKVWSRSQAPRGKAMSGPRFEQTLMEYQVCWSKREFWGESSSEMRGEEREELVKEEGFRGHKLMMDVQPQPYSAIDLIHKQPVRWTDKRVVSCDGGGGVLGHPRIFINVDKPKINMCTYCGLPFVSVSKYTKGSSPGKTANNTKAHTHHREYLESLPSTTYPLAPINDPAEVPENQRLPGTSDQPFGQR